MEPVREDTRRPDEDLLAFVSQPKLEYSFTGTLRTEIDTSAVNVDAPNGSEGTNQGMVHSTPVRGDSDARHSASLLAGETEPSYDATANSSSPFKTEASKSRNSTKSGFGFSWFNK